MIAFALTVAGVASSLVLTAGMLASALSIRRFWPPGERDWRLGAYLAFNTPGSVALMVLPFLDWNSFVLPRPSSLILGAVVLTVGCVGFTAAFFELGVDESVGLEGRLQTGGLYRITRNPQVVFLIATMLGTALVANSVLVSLVSAGMTSWLVAMPFAEEPWLREQYGEEYSDYCDRVPRFVGIATVRRSVDEVVRLVC